MAAMTIDTIENFRITLSSSHGAPAAHWEFEDRRFHLWLYKDQPADAVIHSNARDMKAKSDHRTLDTTAKRWAALMAGIREKVTPEAIEAAREECRQREAKEAQDKLDAEAAAYRKAFAAEAETLGNATLAAEFASLSDDQVRTLGRAICNAR